jgi:hypothetical protein
MTRLGLLPEIPQNWPGSNSRSSSCRWPTSGVDGCNGGCDAADP